MTPLNPTSRSRNRNNLANRVRHLSWNVKAVIAPPAELTRLEQLEEQLR